ncbi:alpha/beta-hydrolase [Neoconidiobolus thromboides FSU 785]|nr:alpha/beta-hydrolase [Neoconidiobolus thromboides FSU 785]
MSIDTITYNTISNLQKQLGSELSIVSGTISSIDNNLKIHYNYNIKDYIQKKSRKYTTQLLLHSLPEFKTIDFQHEEISNYCYKLVQENITILFYDRKSEGGDKAIPQIEVYLDNQLMNILKLNEYHDNFVNFNTFSKPQLKNQKLIYLAQGKRITNEFDNKEYQYIQSYGESLTSTNKIQLISIDLASILKKSFSIKEEQMNDLIKPIDISSDYGEPVEFIYHPLNNDQLILTLFQTNPIKLGYVYCNNRPKSIYLLNLNNGKLQLISDINYSCYNIVTYEENLIYFKNSLGGAHFHCNQVMKYNLTTGNEKVLLDEIKSAEYQQFPGIYCQSLIKKPILKVNKEDYLIVNSQWNCYRVILAISLKEENKVLLLSEVINNCNYSYTILDHCNDYILAYRSNPKVSSELMLGTINPNNKNTIEVEWKVIQQKKIDEDYNKISWEVLNIRNEINNPLECILLTSQFNNINNKKIILNIHGGPHGSNALDWSLLNLHLLLNGYDILHVNYSGSIGYGEDYVNSLIGHLGDKDVKDCQFAIEKIVNEYSYKDINIMGGSHGGFLTAHLIGQYPDYYKKAIMRNPVIQLACNSTVSDIPDWCYYEAGLKFDFNKLPILTSEDYIKLDKQSPLQYISKLKTPILLLIGDHDYRVPKSQSFHYYHLIQSYNNKLAKLFLFPNTGHPLDTPHAEMVSIVEILKHLKQ